MSIEFLPFSLSRPLLEREMEVEVNEVKAAEVDGAEEDEDEDEEVDEDSRRNRRESKKGKENLINRAELLRRVSFNLVKYTLCTYVDSTVELISYPGNY